MSSSLSLGSDELRIIGHAINWQLNVPYEHTPPPQLNQQEVEFLSLLFNDLCDLNRRYLSGTESVSVEVGESYSCASNRIQLPPADFRLMTDAVASFFMELRSSPSELSIVTGSSWSKTSELLSGLQAMNRSASSHAPGG